MDRVMGRQHQGQEEDGARKKPTTHQRGLEALAPTRPLASLWVDPCCSLGSLGPTARKTPGDVIVLTVQPVSKSSGLFFGNG